MGGIYDYYVLYSIICNVQMCIYKGTFFILAIEISETYFMVKATMIANLVAVIV